MKKRIIYFIAILVVASVLFAILYHIDSQYKKTDAYKFMTEYEDLNGKKAKNGKKYRKLDISSDNRMIYSTAKEIVKKIDNNESFIVYFGFAKCPWCRTMVTNLVDLSMQKEMDVYYVDILNIRDVKEYIDGEVKTTKEGDKYYMELLSRLDSVLDKYTLKDENGLAIVDDEGYEIETNEKRIYAPNVVAVVNGTAQKMVTGYSSLIEDPFDTLTEEMNKESIEQLECIFKCFEEENVCTKPDAC